MTVLGNRVLERAVRDKNGVATGCWRERLGINMAWQQGAGESG